MSCVFRGFLSAALLLTLAIVPAGCSSMPPGTPMMIPTLATPPPLTGNMVADGWSGAGMLQLNLDSATSPNCYALLGRATDGALDYLYIGIYCDEFPPSALARVVLGVQTKTVPPICGWKVQFNPLPAPAGGGQISKSEFWRNWATWNAGPGTVQQTPPPVPPMGWPFAQTKSWSQGGGSNLWTLQTRIPIIGGYTNNGCWFPAAGVPFGFYLDVLNNSNAAAPGNQQYPWGVNMAGQIDTHTPDPALWWQVQF